MRDFTSSGKRWRARTPVWQAHVRQRLLAAHALVLSSAQGRRNHIAGAGSSSSLRSALVHRVRQLRSGVDNDGRYGKAIALAAPSRVPAQAAALEERRSQQPTGSFTVWHAPRPPPSQERRH
ncbi:hypothetical protein DCS_00619 [Drechmeria coniospora]|uniref:Uncharacterized protein n=1 Tax=Drechmeria coniospora TaxID=98403 RepID=A0A151GQV4_DRECN|nr:hypothetical protein DCS_00619 [Drechmeria coniospora]KYK59489.1 hypothetical protein DCS_00619 [Drechmeria coniospora]